MKARSFVALLGCAVLLVGCETTDTAQGESLEAKRRAAMEKQKQPPPLDESQTNLRDAQNDLINRDGNPMRSY